MFGVSCTCSCQGTALTWNGKSEFQPNESLDFRAWRVDLAFLSDTLVLDPKRTRVPTPNAMQTTGERMDLTRRGFLHGSLAAAASPLAAPALGRTAAGANDRMRIAIMGAGDRSRFHLDAVTL
jgi:hypothetical protein